ncbi:MAG: DNA repair protein RadA [Humibacillus sp.]|nr:DNA repair protein RadA [Humibacillus sp.]
MPSSEVKSQKATWVKPCEKCGREVARWRGQGDVSCPCGAWYNAGGQRLRDDWTDNEAWRYDDVDDLEGFERQQLAREVSKS